MKLLFNYLDTEIDLSEEKVLALEILHRKYLWRIIQDFILISEEQQIEQVKIIDEELCDISLNNQLLIIMDFFKIELNSKKNLLALNRYVRSELGDKEIDECAKLYKKIYTKLNSLLLELDLPIELVEDFDVETLLKAFKINFKESNNLLDNLFLLLDIEKIFKIHKLVVLVNVKQFLDNDEIQELEKYAIYNKIQLILIDCSSYGLPNIYENKLLIDSDLSENML